MINSFSRKGNTAQFKYNKKYLLGGNDLSEKKPSTINKYTPIFENLFKNKFNSTKYDVVTIYYNIVTIDKQKVYYYNFCKYFIKREADLKCDKLDTIVFCIPKKQLFFNYSGVFQKIVCSAGVIRLVLQLPEKCSKKKNLVKKNLIKFAYTIINGKNSKILLKIIGSIKIVKEIFNTDFNKNEIVKHLIMEPKINFNHHSSKRRKSIKKKLKKNNKHIH